MYVCVLEKFVKLGVPMMPTLEEIAETQSGNFQKLTEVPCPCHTRHQHVPCASLLFVSRAAAKIDPSLSWTGLTIWPELQQACIEVSTE